MLNKKHENSLYEKSVTNERTKTIENLLNGSRDRQVAQQFRAESVGTPGTGRRWQEAKVGHDKMLMVNCQNYCPPCPFAATGLGLKNNSKFYEGFIVSLGREDPHVSGDEPLLQTENLSSQMRSLLEIY